MLPSKQQNYFSVNTKVSLFLPTSILFATSAYGFIKTGILIYIWFNVLDDYDQSVSRFNLMLFYTR